MRDFHDRQPPLTPASKHPHAGPSGRPGPYLPSTSGPPPERSSPPLSPTEQRVHDLLLRRYTEKQVAEELGRSPNTVHVHVRNIYRKLAVRPRQELFDLARFAMESSEEAH